MRTRLGAVVVLGALFLVPAVLSSQSLGDIAAHEREKKERKKGKPVKVYTEADLRRPPERESGAAGAQGAAGAPAASAAPASATSAETPAPAEVKLEGTPSGPSDAQRNWKERFEKASAEAARLSAEADRIQQDLNVIGDNPYNPIRQRLVGQLEEARKKLAAAQVALADLDEERRRAGWPQ